MIGTFIWASGVVAGGRGNCPFPNFWLSENWATSLLDLT